MRSTVAAVQSVPPAAMSMLLSALIVMIVVPKILLLSSGQARACKARAKPRMGAVY